jgi:adenylate kinase
MGPPGSGKGTQAKSLVDEYGWVQLSTGELFRDHIGRKTDLGTKVKAFIDKGAYVPDDLTVAMVRERLREISKGTRIVFDGFPRTVAQAEELDRLLAEFDRAIDAVILLDAPRDELFRRLSKRAQQLGRSDDTPEVIGKRLDVYEEQTKPVVDHYAKKNGQVRRVDGVGAVHEVGARLREAAER